MQLRFIVMLIDRGPSSDVVRDNGEAKKMHRITLATRPSFHTCAHQTNRAMHVQNVRTCSYILKHFLRKKIFWKCIEHLVSDAYICNIIVFSQVR